jgi:hypothetical protein
LSQEYTGLFISPSGISDPCGTVAGMVTPKGSMSTEGETLPVSVLPYRCSICAPLVMRQMSNFGKFQDTTAYLFPVHAMFRHDCPPSGEICKYATVPSTRKKTWRDSLSINMLLSAVSVLVVVQSSLEIPEGLLNNPVYNIQKYNMSFTCRFITLRSLACHSVGVKIIEGKI